MCGFKNAFSWVDNSIDNIQPLKTPRAEVVHPYKI